MPLSQLNNSLHISAIARLSLILSIIRILQNAASQSTYHLHSTRSIILNFTLGVWAFTVGIVEGCIDSTSFIVRKSLNMIMISWPFLYKALTSINIRIRSTKKKTTL